MKRFLSIVVMVSVTLLMVELSFAGLGGQVFYKYGTANLKDDRGEQVFTDTNGASGKNDDDSGNTIGAGLDVPLTKLFGNTLLGEVMVDYAKFSDKKVIQATSALLGSPETSNVTVSELNVVVAPKYRFEFGKIRPWVIPIGLAFMVNSPPSNDTTYLDTGYHYGLGVEYMLHDLLSLGVDYRNTIASGDPNIKATYSTLGIYVGINF